MEKGVGRRTAQKSCVVVNGREESACGGMCMFRSWFTVYAPCCLMWISFVSFVCVAIAWI